ncbi:MAG: isoprenylcysteine carboxylmethyltransferase family protein [Pseudolabrys sp.]
MTAHDTPGVIAPPPLIGLAVIVGGLLLDWLLPAYLLTVLLSLEDRLVIGALLLLSGLALAISALGAFRAARTNPEPWKPSRALVAGGIFRWLRNPMYVGGLLVLAGLSIALASDWMLVLAIGSAFVLHYGVVLREERYLAAKFGPAYAAYRDAVPRYGWPF